MNFNIELMNRFIYFTSKFLKAIFMSSPEESEKWEVGEWFHFRVVGSAVDNIDSSTRVIEREKVEKKSSEKATSKSWKLKTMSNEISEFSTLHTGSLIRSKIYELS